MYIRMCKSERKRDEWECGRKRDINVNQLVWCVRSHERTDCFIGWNSLFLRYRGAHCLSSSPFLLFHNHNHTHSFSLAPPLPQCTVWHFSVLSSCFFFFNLFITLNTQTCVHIQNTYLKLRVRFIPVPNEMFGIPFSRDGPNVKIFAHRFFCSFLFCFCFRFAISKASSHGEEII